MSERRRGLGASLLLLAAAVVPTLAVAPAASAAVIRLINNDNPNEGFNDPTPVAPLGGNTGTTLGAQRLIVFQRAVDLWAALLESPVEIRVGATFDPLDCNANEVTLGEAGPTSVFRDFAGAPLANTYYPSALADRLAGMDLAPSENDIEAQFNSSFGTTCPFPQTWYYGLDGAPGTDAVDLLSVVLHELGHGMGFLSFVDVNSGARMKDTDDVFSEFLIDDRTGKTFPEMTDAERESAIIGAISPGTCSGSSQACQTDGDCGAGTCQRHTHLKWNGPQVMAASGKLTVGADAMGRVEMYAAPQPVPGSSVSHWNDLLAPDELMEPAYTGPLHDIGLAAQALADMGWNLPGVAAASPTATPAPVPTATPGGMVVGVASPTPTAAGLPCMADCNGDGRVTITELVAAVDIALGTAPLSTCRAADADSNGVVAVNELVGAVHSALDGCETSPTPIPTITTGLSATPTLAAPTATLTTAAPTPTLTTSAPTVTPTSAAPTATPATVGPTITPAGSCPLSFQDDSPDGCLYIGTWNPSCGDNTLEVLFNSNGTDFIAAIGTGTQSQPMLVGIAGKVTNPRTATLLGWFTDFTNLSDFQPLSGIATLSDDGTTLAIKHFDSPPFSINDCDFTDYEGSFERTVVSSGSQQLNITQLLPMVQHQLTARVETR